MDAGLIDRIESNAESAASALFAGAVGYGVYGWLRAGFFRPEVGVYAGGAALLAYPLCRLTLGAVATRKHQFTLPIFDLREVEIHPDELLLTDADRLEPNAELLLTEADRFEAAPATAHPEPLVLDDILTEIGPDARVVRLFDRKAMPTPGQLKSRIDAHLEQGHLEHKQLERASFAGGASDASQALLDALAELRRSLR